jgi:hypothetical protein
MGPASTAARRATFAAIAAGMLVLLLAPFRANAALSATQVAVYRSCSGGACDSDDQPVARGASLAGDIVVAASSRGSLGLSFLRVDATGPGGTACMRRWSPGGQTSYANQFTWSTYRWPTSSAASGCSADSLHGDITTNGTYTFKVTARESVTGNEQTDTFAIKLANLPVAPAWASDPSAGGEPSHPVVRIQWRQNPEPDIDHYVVARQDPGGAIHTTSVSASNPGQQGCSKSDGVYTCNDGSFAATKFGGTYRYALASYRSDGSGGSIKSSSSEVRSTNITEPPPPPPPSPSPQPTGGGGGGSSEGGSSGGGAVPFSTPKAYNFSRPSPTPRPSGATGAPATHSDSSEFFTGTYSKTLPYGAQDGFVPVPGVTSGARPNQTLIAGTPGDDSRDPQSMLAPVAGGLLALLGAAHILRVLAGR